MAGSSGGGDAAEKQQQIVSPFDHRAGEIDDADDGSSTAQAVATITAATDSSSGGEYLELTWENVEAVLGEMRPYLIQDGGNVVIDEIDGPVVKLQLQVGVCVCVCIIACVRARACLCVCVCVYFFFIRKAEKETTMCMKALDVDAVATVYDAGVRIVTICFFVFCSIRLIYAHLHQGACGTCPSSTQTMKMGLERGLKEKIPEIQEVIQAMPQGPALNQEQVDVVLDGVRPFLQVAGGTIDTDRIDGVGGLQPTIWLKMAGSSASLNSVKLEIAQRLQRHFMLAGLHVEWM
jgi:Fe-S cluster biogenesis protein NfuA